MKNTHECTTCGSHNTSNCIRLGHMAMCEADGCERAFQVISSGCTLHKYRDGFNLAYYSKANGMWFPPEKPEAGEEADAADEQHDGDENVPEEEELEPWKKFEEQKAAEQREAEEARRVESALQRSKSTKAGKYGKKVEVEKKSKGDKQ